MGDVGDLMSWRWKGGIMLRNVLMNRGVVFRNAVDKCVLLVKRLASDIADGRGNCCAEQERLTLGSRRKVLDDAFDVGSESHIK